MPNRAVSEVLALAKSFTFLSVKNPVNMEPTRLNVTGTPASAAAARSPCSRSAESFLQRLVDARLRKQLQRLDAGGHGQRISRKRSCLIDGPDGRYLFHDLALAAERAHRQTAADDLAEAGQVGFDLVELLCAAEGDAEAGHDLVEDQDDAVLIADLTQPFEETRLRRHAAHVPRHRLNDDAGDLLAFAGGYLFYRSKIIVSNGQA